jgi:hypothetical protein
MTSVNYNGCPVILELEASGLVGGKTLILKDASGMLKLEVPAALWDFIIPGDHIHMTFSPVKVTVTPVEELLPGIGGIRLDN